jgi:hypothetical protein
VRPRISGYHERDGGIMALAIWQRVFITSAH